MKPHKYAARQRRMEVLWQEYLKRKRAGVLPSQTRMGVATKGELKPNIKFIGLVAGVSQTKKSRCFAFADKDGRCN